MGNSRIAAAMLQHPTTLVGGSPLSGSTSSWKGGSKKRRLDPAILATLPELEALTNPATTFQLKLKGLSDDLSCLIACGISGAENVLPIVPSLYPAAPGTIQVLPKTNHQGYPLYLREVFQDPTATDNKNHPLAQDIPYGWSFTPEGVDEAIIIVTLPQDAYNAAPLVGQLVVEVTIEYVGAALNIASDNDRKQIEWILGQVQLSPAGSPLVFGGT